MSASAAHSWYHDAGLAALRRRTEAAEDQMSLYKLPFGSSDQEPDPDRDPTPDRHGGRQETDLDLAREVMRLRDDLRRQQLVVSELTSKLLGQPLQSPPLTVAPPTLEERLPGPAPTPPPVSEAVPSSEPGQPNAPGSMKDRIEHLEKALAQEKELVLRLRASKLELERRAVEAETALAELRRRGPIERLLGKEAR